MNIKEKKILILPVCGWLIYFISYAQYNETHSPAGERIQKDITLHEAAIKFSGSIKAEDLKSHVYKLASPEFEGRETAGPGQRKAAEYIASQMDAGHIGMFSDSIRFQRFPLDITSPDSPMLIINGYTFRFLEDFYFFPGMNDTIIADKEILFANFGITDGKYDNYKKAKTENKIVMILDDEPYNAGTNTFLLSGDSVPSEWSENRHLKTVNAQRAGAKALLVVVDSIEQNVTMFRHFLNARSYSLAGEQRRSFFRIPVLYISRRAAMKIFENGSMNYSEAIQRANKRNPKPLWLKASVKIEIEMHHERAHSENVIGFLPGTDLKEEALIITAHYDHLGRYGNEIYYGADDDASGTAALLEIAQAFAMAKEEGYTPRRSIIFMPVSGEEKGLLGSEYYTKNPLIPLENSVTNLNIDMIGRTDTAHAKNNEYVYIIGGNRMSNELHFINELANEKYVNLSLDYTYNDPADPNRFFYRSDHYNFAKNNIPVIFYFSGVHEDYHKPTDTPDKINFNKMEKITRLIFFTAWEIANRQERVRADAKEKQ